MNRKFSIFLAMIFCLGILFPISRVNAEVTAEYIIEISKSAMDNPFGEEGLKRITDAQDLVKTELPQGHPLRVALEANLENALLCHDTFEDIGQIWIILGNPGWQVNYSPAIDKVKGNITTLKDIFGESTGFIVNFNGVVMDMDNIYDAFHAVDLAQVSNMPENINLAKEKISKIQNQAVVNNLNNRLNGIIGGDIQEDFYIISID